MKNIILWQSEILKWLGPHHSNMGKLCRVCFGRIAELWPHSGFHQSESHRSRDHDKGEHPPVAWLETERDRSPDHDEGEKYFVAYINCQRREETSPHRDSI
jgi:hypothetical protein